ncbi:cryptochrome/photolyase family protein [Alteromonas sediminis]|nr:deoxyribodipyrimidine photo-lyase [Alteromonas sediminis]
MWFRKDLRLKDNPALHFAAKQGDVLPVFILDTQTDQNDALGGASQWWLHHSLESLNRDLGGKLLVLKGAPKPLLEKLIDAFDIQVVTWNRCYEANSIERDTDIKQHLTKKGLTVKSFNGSLLWEPMQITKQDGSPYKVFTPYYRKGCLAAPPPRYPEEKPNVTTLDSKGYGLCIEELCLLPDIAWDQGLKETWQPGEEGAATRLHTFLDGPILRYKDDRNIPAIRGTSMLGPHFHWGEMSVNQAWYATLDKFGGMDKEGVDTFLSELGWREFSYYLLFHNPQLRTKNVASKFDAFPWREDSSALKRWQKGQTGIPIVDAGMRELWQTGYMHNRVRMVVGSFLVKNLLLDWRLGERWFWDCLCDADTASNSASWQWVAGCGADAAPYFRVFNPVLQGEKFDKHGEYVKTYCPELSALPNKYIHKPWDAPKSVLSEAGVTLGEHYPKPIVDLKASRVRALEAFDAVKQAS